MSRSATPTDFAGLPVRVLALEPYYGGSHQAFLDGWRGHSRHDWTLLTRPAFKWKWRMRNSALAFADALRPRVAAGQRWDVLWCSDMLDLAAWRGLAPPPLSNLPAVVYFHENQLTYPVRHQQERDYHFGYTNMTTALAATEVWFNSTFNRDSFLEALPRFLQRMPDDHPVDVVARIAAKTRVMPPGVDPLPARGPRPPGPLRILWAARWEHDKNPGLFFDAIRRLDHAGIVFRLSVIGERFRDVPACFDRARRQFARCIDRWGYQQRRADYLAALREADVIVSTADHEFFGLSVVEAVLAGAWPVLPRRLAYPEIFTDLPPEAADLCFFDGSAEALAGRLADLARRMDRGVSLPTDLATRAVRAYTWPRVAPRLDTALAARAMRPPDCRQSFPTPGPFSNGKPMRKRIALDGAWQMRQVGKPDWTPATVPGCVHTDLMAAGKIPDPLVDTNELDVLWIDEADWEYERTCNLDERFCAHKVQQLVCDGLDTVARVFVNDRLVGETANMFRQYRFDVAPHLVPGENRIRIVFRSPTRSGKKRAEATSTELFGSEYDWGSGRTRKTYRPYLRKAQYQFGWDWGPCLATSGIWRSIRLVAGDAPLIEYLTTRQQHESDRVRLNVRAHLFVPENTVGRLEVFVNGASRPAAVTPARLSAGHAVVEADVSISSPRLWWPAGYGEPHLYTIAARWVEDDGSIADETEARVGLRTVELVREPDAAGETFFFRINGTDVFCKGANWIPADSFPTRVSEERYEFLLRAAVDANMNMLRVWGGGIYESDTFYRLCDELGLMVWQDFMFACAAYPADDAFCNNVAAEARHQIRRLANHPSIVLWCGDNENEWLFFELMDPNNDQRPSREDYDRLVLGTLASTVAEEDPGRPWWPSSPSSQGAARANDPARGDVHYWEMWQPGRELDHYLRVSPRFCSEFGFQSLPSLSTLRTAITSKICRADDPVVVHHQRSAGGNERITAGVKRLFHEPADFDEMCYLSQLVHGLALKNGVEHWRRLKPHCMGTLYWQLEDCWVVVSWASIDYALRYKAPHYFARRFYSPLLGSLVHDEDELHLWATSDLTHAIDAKWRLELWNLDGRRVSERTGVVSLAAGASRSFMTIPHAGLFEQVDKASCIARLRIDAPGCRHENVHVFAPYRHLPLACPRIEATIEPEPGTPRAPAGASTARITLNTDNIALFVEVDPGDIRGILSDNYFTLFPGQPLSVTFRAPGSVDLSRLQAALRVRSLRGSATCQH